MPVGLPLPATEAAADPPRAALQQRALRGAAGRLHPHAELLGLAACRRGGRGFGALLFERDRDGGDGRHLLGCHSGELPCLRDGSCSRLVRSIAERARQHPTSVAGVDHVVDVAPLGRLVRVQEPVLVLERSARRVGLATSDAASISLRKMMLTAPSAPITAISADGHANAMSAPIDFEFMTTYAPP